MRNRLRVIKINIQIFFFRLAYYVVMAEYIEDEKNKNHELIILERHLTVIYTKFLLTQK